MLNHEKDVLRYHKLLPVRIRRYLRNRGISDSVIDQFRLGWNGQRITIPVYDRNGHFVFFRLAKDPDSTLPTAKMLSASGTQAELYGWEHLRAQPKEIIICEGEFDRLVLETQGFVAVTSTGGAGTFRADWAQYFLDIPYVYVCFDLDDAGHIGAERIARLIPHARVVRLPSELIRGGDVTDFFVHAGKTAKDYRALLDRAQPLDIADTPPPGRLQTGPLPSPTHTDVALLKAEAAIEWLVGQYMPLRRSGRNFIGRCPFHPDRTPSFVVFPNTKSFHCFGCRATGDAISFLMRRESLSFPEALEALKLLTRI